MKTSLFFAALGILAILFVYAKVKRKLFSEKESFFCIFIVYFPKNNRLFFRYIRYFVSPIVTIPFSLSVCDILAFSAKPTNHTFK